jgi:virginiamycin A acetyltransferase
MMRRAVMARHRARWFKDEVEVAPGSVVGRAVVIGRRTKINGPSHIDACEIGSYCAIGGRLVVRPADHLMQYLGIQNEAQVRVIGGRSLLGEARPVRIGHGVWIGDSVIVLGGVTIGNGAVVGAGAVVTRPVPPYAIAVGNPAKVVGYRYPEPVVAELESLEWWTWDDERLRRNRDLFDLDLSSVDPVELAVRLRDA